MTNHTSTSISADLSPETLQAMAKGADAKLPCLSCLSCLSCLNCISCVSCISCFSCFTL